MRIKEIKVGLLTIVGLVVGYFGFNYLKGNSLFEKGVTYYSVYHQVEGLHVGSKVVLNGFPVGRVVNISFLNGGTGRLIAEYVVVDETIQISENTQAQILNTDLFGSKAINLIIGNSMKMANIGDTLVGLEVEGMFAELSNRIAPYEERVQIILGEVDTTLKSVQISIKALNVILSGEQSRIKEIMTNLASITQNIESNNAHISGSLENIHQITDSLSQLEIKQVLDNANLAVLSMKAAVDKMNNGSGTIAKMLNDSALYHNLNQSAIDLDLLMKDLRENPKRYVHISVFGGRDKSSKKSKD